MRNCEIELSNVDFKYSGKSLILNDISFFVRKGESVGIIGANGAGKSTLLMLIVGVLFPNSGRIAVDSIQVSKSTLSAVRKKVGMVFQEPDDQLFMTTVFDDVAFGPRNMKLSEDEVEIRVNSALDAVGALYLKERAPFKLSGGEKRAAAIATVLSMTPQVLVMDEPTLALDPKARRKIISILKTFEQTKIITSHDLDMIFETCDRVIILRDGKIESDGSAKEILTNSKVLDKCGLEMPLSLQNCINCKATKMTWNS